jgi:S-adenosylmethionine/arginine decarboxylase-like enzyme
MSEETTNEVVAEAPPSYWGYHLILDCNGCDHDSITNYDNVYNFAKKVVVDIDMVPYGEPQIHNFGIGNKAGFTLVQLIETSNICAHFVNELNHMYLDVFSCKPFDPNKVIECAKEFFKFEGSKIGYIERQA